MRRRDILAGIAGIGAAGGVYGAASVLTSGDAPPGSNGSATDSASDAGPGPDIEPYEPLGSVDLRGTRELVTSDDGTVAYLAVDDGIATVDLSTPAAPTLLAEQRGFLPDDPDGPLQLLWDVSLDDDRLLAAGPAQFLQGSDLHAALLFDVGDPADPELLDAHRTQYPIHNCFFHDDTCYLTANGEQGNPLVLLDAGDDELTEVGRWSVLDHDIGYARASRALRPLHDVVVRGDVAYLPYWDAGTYLVDVSDPTEPSYLGHTSAFDRSELTSMTVEEARTEYVVPPGNSHFAQPDESGDLLAVGREAWAVPDGDCVAGGPGGIDLYDASDPAEIAHLATIEPPASYSNTQGGQFTTAHNFDLRDGRLHSSWYFGGVKVHDVSDPADPEEIAWWRQPESASFWTARSAVAGEYFVASSAGDAGGYDDGIPGRVYVFPDRAGSQPDPPDLTESPEGEEPDVEC